MLKYSEQFAREIGDRADVHPNANIYQFLIENMVLKTEEDSIRHYFYDRQKSAETLKELLFSQLGFGKDNTPILNSPHAMDVLPATW